MPVPSDETDYVAEYLPLMPENYNLPNALMTAFGAYFHRKIRFIRSASSRVREEQIPSTSVKL